MSVKDAEHAHSGKDRNIMSDEHKNRLKPVGKSRQSHRFCKDVRYVNHLLFNQHSLSLPALDTWDVYFRFIVNMPSYRVQPNSCSDQPHCLSSYDDRPPHFIAPWEYEAMTKEDAILRLKETVVALGGKTQSSAER